MAKAKSSSNLFQLNTSTYILLGAMLVIGFFLGAQYMKYEGKKVANVPPNQENSMNDWETYQNEEYGFSFMYPTSGLLEEKKGEVVIWESKEKGIQSGSSAPPSTPFVNISYYKVPITSDLDEFANSIDAPSQDQQRLLTKEPVSINGIQAFQYTYEFIPNGQTWNPIYFMSEDVIYRINSQGQKGSGGFFDSILSTFKLEK